MSIEDAQDRSSDEEPSIQGLGIPHRDFGPNDPIGGVLDLLIIIVVTDVVVDARSAVEQKSQDQKPKDIKIKGVPNQYDREGQRQGCEHRVLGPYGLDKVLHGRLGLLHRRKEGL